MPENITTTGIDSLVEYLKNHGQTDAVTVAGVLAVDPKVIEQWANILENAGAVKITYKVDRMYISPVTAITKEQVETAKKVLEVKESTFEAEVRAKQLELVELGKKIESLDKLVSGAEGMFNQKGKNSKRMLDELTKTQKQADAIFKNVKGRTEFINGISGKMDAQIASMKNAAEAAQSMGGWSEDINKIVSDMKNRIKLINETNHSMRKKFDSEIERQRKEMHDLFSSVAGELEAVNELVMQKQRDGERTERENSLRQREVNRIVREAEKQREEVINSVASTKQNIDALYADADKRSKELVGIMEAYKKQFGELADLDSKINSVTSQIAAAKKEKDDIKKELEFVTASIKLSQKVKQKEPEKASAKAAEAKTKMGEATSRIKKLDENVDEADKAMDDTLK